MNQTNFLMSQSKPVPSSAKTRLIPLVSADQPAVDELCHILAHILRRLAEQNLAHLSKE